MCVVTYDIIMTAVGLGESSRYGLKLYGYVLGITVVGGAGLALGVALAWPEIQAWRAAGETAAPVSGIAGGVLFFLGLSVLATGYLGTAYKILADGVAAGRAGPEAAAAAEPSGSEAAAESSEPAEPTPADPNVGASGAEVGSMAADDVEAEPSADPPEPSPEEIAFGSSGGDASEDEPVEEPSGGGGPLPGQNASSDPLADPSDE